MVKILNRADTHLIGWTVDRQHPLIRTTCPACRFRSIRQPVDCTRSDEGYRVIFQCLQYPSEEYGDCTWTWTELVTTDTSNPEVRPPVPRITDIIGYSCEVSTANGPLIQGFISARHADSLQRDFEQYLTKRDREVAAMTILLVRATTERES